MWFKQHPWVFPIIIGVIGFLYITLNICANVESKKIQARGENRHVSGIPFLGGIHLLIAGLISPCKWLALLSVLDYTFWEFIYVVFFYERRNKPKEEAEAEEKKDSEREFSGK